MNHTTEETTMNHVSAQASGQTLPLRGDWATAEAKLRELERRLKHARTRQDAQPAPVGVQAPSEEWPERVLSAVIPALAIGALPQWLGVADRTVAAILAGLVCAIGVYLLGERARRMALGETLPQGAGAVLPSAPWWLALALLAALAGLLVGGMPLESATGGAHVPRLIATVVALLATLAPAWWSASRWQRHATARLQAAQWQQRNDRAEAELALLTAHIEAARQEGEVAAQARLWCAADAIGPAPRRAKVASEWSEVEA